VHDAETIARGGVDNRHLDRGRRMTGTILKWVARKLWLAKKAGEETRDKCEENQRE